MREQLALDDGFVVPPVHIRDNLQLKPERVRHPAEGRRDRAGRSAARIASSPSTPARRRRDPRHPTLEPAFGLPAIWIAKQDRERAQIAGYTVVDPTTVVVTHLTEIIRRHAHELLGRQEVQQLLDAMQDAARRSSRSWSRPSCPWGRFSGSCRICFASRSRSGTSSRSWRPLGTRPTR